MTSVMYQLRTECDMLKVCNILQKAQLEMYCTQPCMRAGSCAIVMSHVLQVNACCTKLLRGSCYHIQQSSRGMGKCDWIAQALTYSSLLMSMSGMGTCGKISASSLDIIWMPLSIGRLEACYHLVRQSSRSLGFRFNLNTKTCSSLLLSSHEQLQMQLDMHAGQHTW